MRKLVNGKVVDIKNLELFELAAEGLALQNTAVSITSDGIEGEIKSDKIKKYIKQYDLFFKYMPYPLYAIETDIKYATLGNFIKTFSTDDISMWVNNGLYIKIDNNTGMTLRIVNNTWSIVYNKDEHSDNTSMSLFKESIGYDEYTWVLERMVKKESTGSFYSVFMPDFLKACNGQAMVLKWELENILTFGAVPNKIEFKENKIIDPELNQEYILDIYCTGTIDTDEKVTTWSLCNTGNVSKTKYKQMKTYSFDLYSKSTTQGKLEKCNIIGIQNMFLTLCGLKQAHDMSTFPTFTGIIQDSKLIFTIDKKLYITKSNRIAKCEDIAHNVELYNVSNKKVYFIKSKRITDKISKDTLYSYDMIEGIVKICKIIFAY